MKKHYNYVQLRLTDPVLSEIDEAIGVSSFHSSRHAWILKAIEEKTQREWDRNLSKEVALARRLETGKGIEKHHPRDWDCHLGGQLAPKERKSLPLTKFPKYRVGILGCSKEKSDSQFYMKARDRYTSQLFKKSYAYLKCRTDLILIISAKHGLIKADEEITNYDKTLDDMSARERNNWAWAAYTHLLDYPENVEFTFLGGEGYQEIFQNKIQFTNPLRGKRIGERLSFLTKDYLEVVSSTKAG